MRRIFLGVEIGGTKIQVFIADPSIQIIERKKFFVGDQKKASAILDRIRENIDGLIKRYEVTAIGVGYGGPIDHDTGIVNRSHHISGWENFDLKKWLTGFTGKPVVADNDANVAALGEAWFGAGRGFSRVFYMTLGSGVGGGLVINGDVYHGQKPTEMEIGHVRLNKKGTILENSCSGWAVDKKIREYVRKHPQSKLAALSGGQIGGESRYLSEAIRLGEEGARCILEDTADDLAFGLSHMVHLVNPEIIILGGGFSMTGEIFREKVEEYLPRYLMKAMDPPIIRLSELREDVVCVGAAWMAKKYLEN